jgi:hypothetical protein
MEEMDLVEKITFLRDNEDKKCMNKNEVLQQHEATWKTNGISAFRERDEFTVLDCVYLNDYCVKVTVQLMLNGDEFDAVCGETDRQYERKDKS